MSHSIVIAVYLMSSAAIVEVQAPSLTACLDKKADVSTGLNNLFHGPHGVETIAKVLACKIEKIDAEEIET